VQEALTGLREDSLRFEEFCIDELDELEGEREEFERQRQGLEQQRAALAEELNQARAQLSRLASVAVELAEARTELVQVKTEVHQQREAAAEAQRNAAELEKQIEELRRDNAALEIELSEGSRRGEAANQRISEQRAEWVGELLRSALDLQTQGGADLKVVHDDADPPPGDSQSIARVDPVLGAVMQQFEALQKGRERGKGRQGVA